MIKKKKDTKQSPSLWPLSPRAGDADSLSILAENLQPVFDRIIDDERLDNSISPQFTRIYLPLAEWIARKHNDKPIVIGINGAQGSGKSTICKILKQLLSQAFGKSVIELSIDDLYLSRQRREELANKIHPLFKTRGVPGTHDIQYALKIFSTLLDRSDDLTIKIPVFDKAIDDLLPEQDWLSVNNDVDIILFEGWCVGAQAQESDQLQLAVNQLEVIEDADLIWRTYINKQLNENYQKLFSYIDYQVMLKVPDMRSIFEWRSLQEKKLATSCSENESSMKHVMSEQELKRFIMHYERITRSTLEEMPNRADVVLQLDHHHQVCDVKIK